MSGYDPVRVGGEFRGLVFGLGVGAKTYVSIPTTVGRNFHPKRLDREELISLFCFL